MIQIDQLSRVFQSGGRDLTAVEGVSFTVGQGEVFGLLGPNGAGKTTTLRMILGLLQPTSGDARVQGYPVSRQPEEVRRRLGLVSASAGVYPWLTPREVLTFFAELYDVPAPSIAERSGELSELLQIGRFLDQRCATLSTGQKQRVNLALALMHDPPVVLMDEPTRGLDVVGSELIFNYIRLLRERNKAVIVSTHRLDEAARLCDRFGLLHRGQLRHCGTLETLQRETGRETLTEIFLDLLEPGPLSPSA
ncbi:MAG: ABC transporter ATP-binding protein [Planctomycetaceae bacterium]|nr:ABC transporter ATP-binding protein [Planctomycetaceae bacterium]